MIRNPGYELKVIGVGLPRTGTLSIKVALEILGFGKCYHMIENIEKNDNKFWIDVCDGQERDWAEVFKDYHSTTDAPACFFWEELLKENPNAKVILTVRNSPEAWWKSSSETVFQAIRATNTFKDKLNCFIFPSQRLFRQLGERLKIKMGAELTKEKAIEYYTKYNEDVIEKCSSDKLLIFNVNQGWEPLCKFLGVPVPDTPFPRLNDTQSFRKKLFYMKNLGLIIFILVWILVLITSFFIHNYIKGN